MQSRVYSVFLPAPLLPFGTFEKRSQRLISKRLLSSGVCFGERLDCGALWGKESKMTALLLQRVKTDLICSAAAEEELFCGVGGARPGETDELVPNLSGVQGGNPVEREETLH